MVEAAVQETAQEEKGHPKDIKEILKWESPSRPFKKRDSRYFINIALILVLIAAIALFFQEFLLLAVLLALFFYLYVSGTIEPGKLEHRITNQGVTTAEHSYIWEDLTDFWFSERYGETILNVGTKHRFPSRLIMIVPFIDRDKVKKILVKYLPFREAPPSNWVEDVTNWATNKLPPSLR